MSKNQGGFLADLKGIRSSEKTQRSRFTWETKVGKSPVRDTAVPAADISKVTSKSSAPRKPETLPTTPNGHLDTPAIREDLCAQLKAHKKR